MHWTQISDKNYHMGWWFWAQKFLLVVFNNTKHAAFSWIGTTPKNINYFHGFLWKYEIILLSFSNLGMEQKRLMANLGICNNSWIFSSIYRAIKLQMPSHRSSMGAQHAHKFLGVGLLKQKGASAPMWGVVHAHLFLLLCVSSEKNFMLS